MKPSNSPDPDPFASLQPQDGPRGGADKFSGASPGNVLRFRHAPPDPRLWLVIGPITFLIGLLVIVVVDGSLAQVRRQVQAAELAQSQRQLQHFHEGTALIERQMQTANLDPSNPERQAADREAANWSSHPYTATDAEIDASVALHQEKIFYERTQAVGKVLTLIGLVIVAVGLIYKRRRKQYDAQAEGRSST